MFIILNHEQTQRSVTYFFKHKCACTEFSGIGYRFCTAMYEHVLSGGMA